MQKFLQQPTKRTCGLTCRWNASLTGTGEADSEGIVPYNVLEEKKNDVDVIQYMQDRTLPPLVHLPSVFQNSVKEIQTAEGNPKRVRQLGLQIIAKIKENVLSKHRGGMQPNFFDARPQIQLRGSKRQLEKHALRRLTMDLFSVDGLEDADVRELIDGHPSMEILKASELWEQEALRKKLGAKLYNGLGALAYTAARLPSTYASIKHVLQRLKYRSSYHWVPKTMLDFGAGPGTAAWAAHSVWPADSLHVTAVEISHSMVDMGMRILDRCRIASVPDGDSGGNVAQEHLVPCDPQKLHISWRPFFPREKKNVLKKYDIVMGAYVLNELRDDVHRHQVLNRLIQSCGEYIVLIESGSPYGFSLIEHARSYILKMGRKYGTPFHVVAPCPHDGPCPLKGKNSWCHFSQQYQRTEEQRVAVRSLMGKAPRDTQAEKFSYVVLKRGRRKHGWDTMASVNGMLQLEGKPGMQTKTYAAGDALENTEKYAMNLMNFPQSRILRSPRKRKGHVMLDLCSVLDEKGRYMGENIGTIVRQTISVGKSKSIWGSKIPYRLARKSTWGDTWPVVYQASMPTSEVQLSEPDSTYDRGSMYDEMNEWELEDDEVLRFLFDEDGDDPVSDTDVYSDEDV